MGMRAGSWDYFGPSKKWMATNLQILFNLKVVDEVRLQFDEINGLYKSIIQLWKFYFLGKTMGETR